MKTTKHIQARLTWDQIMDPTTKLPETEKEFFAWFDKIATDLSPENLTCDGELSGAAVRKRAKELNAEWKELEILFGRPVTENEIYTTGICIRD